MSDVSFEIKKVENGFVLIENLGWTVKKYVFLKFDELINWIRNNYEWWIK